MKRFSTLLFVLFFSFGCGEQGPYELGPPEGWQAANNIWWSAGTDTTGKVRDLSTLQTMGVRNSDIVYASSPSVARQRSVRIEQYRYALKNELIQLFRNHPVIVDSLFEAYVMPVIRDYNMTGDVDADLAKLKLTGFRTIRRHYHEPRVLQNEDLQIPHPDSLAHQGIGGKVTVQVYIDEAGNVTTLHLVKSVHPVLDDITMRLATASSWEPAYILRGGKSDAIPSWARYNLNFPIRTAQ